MDKKLILEVIGPTVFTGPKWQEIKEDKNLIFVWITMTSVTNIVLLKSITLTWRWPFVRWVACFTNVDDSDWI